MLDATKCVACGRPVGENDRFCPGCGTATVVPMASGPDSGSKPVSNPGSTGGSGPRSGAPATPPPPAAPADPPSSDAPTMVSHVSLQTAMAKRLVDATAGEFEILRELGHGAMGAVYLARDISLSRRVAIKVVAPHLLSDEGMISRFRLEAQTIASLRHPNIVNIHAVRQSDELHYFVMEFIDGPTLRTIVKAHAPLSIPVIQALLFQIGSALSYAHRAGRGVIHRDVKPANIMVSHEGIAFLTDFGISKISESTGLTQTGATIGTPEYMSPEQCRGEALTGASDQYALGIVAYEMLTGHTPYTGNQYQIMMAHTSGQAREPLQSIRPDCPDEVAEAVERMLAKEPEERFPDLDTAVTAMGGAPLGYRDPVRLEIVELTGQGEPGGGVDTHSPLSPHSQKGRKGSLTGQRPGAGTGPRSAGGTGPRSGAASGSRSAGSGTRSGVAASVKLVGAPEAVATGESFALKADVRGERDLPLPSAPVRWTSSDPSIASVKAGRVEALSPGTVSITASSGKVATSILLTVTDPAMAAAGGATVISTTAFDGAVATGGRARSRPTWVIAAGVVGLTAVGGFGAFTLLRDDAPGSAGAAQGVLADATPPAGQSPAGTTPSGGTPPPSGDAETPPAATTPAATTPPAATPAQQTTVTNPPATTTPPAAQTAANTTPPATNPPAANTGRGTTPPANNPPANTPPAAPTATRLDVAIPNPSMTVGGSQIATVAAFGQGGTPLAPGAVPITWASRSQGVVSVNAQSGALAANGAGTAWIVATSGTGAGAVRDSVLVTATAPVAAAPTPAAVTVQSVDIDGGDFTLEAGGTRVVTAVVRDSNQRLINRPIRWSSANPGVATVDATTGEVRGVAAGQTFISATVEDILNRVSVTVSPAAARLPGPGVAPGLIEGYVASLARGDRNTVLGYWPTGAGVAARRTELEQMMGATGFTATLRSAASPTDEGGVAVATFVVAASYRSGFATVSPTLTFRAEFRPEGSNWQLGPVTLTTVQQ